MHQYKPLDAAEVVLKSPNPQHSRLYKQLLHDT